MELNKLYCMDNLELLKQLDDNSIDLIYSDILYATGRKFNDYQDLKYDKETVYEFYIPRIKEMHRVLSDKGTLVLQMDYRISHWLRCICDDYFGYKNCINEVLWCYSSGGACKKKLSQKNDTLIVYAKNPKLQTFNPMKQKSYNRDFKPYRFKGVEEFCDEYGLWYTNINMTNVWNDISMVGRTSSERQGYDTQKPILLTDRIIELYSDEGDTVADFFMGSGGFIVSANNKNRNYIGCDINPRAMEVTEKRLKNN